MDPWTIVAVLGGVIGVLAGFIGKLYADNRSLQRALEEAHKAHLETRQAHERMLAAMLEELKKKQGGTP